MRRLLLAGLCLLLAACAARTPVPERPPRLELPQSLQVQRQADGEVRDWLLVVQAEGPALRWSLFDPLGVPLSRQLLQDGSWRNDGLLPPNDEARELFAALLYALAPVEALQPAYAGIEQRIATDGRRELAGRWSIAYRAPLDFDLQRRDGPHYRITALDEEPR
ncbi:DUF3261 domain-containing protein [Pseudomonas sp. TUM22785]|uniref:DUF3261 domain-containing protein n=1 Tax=Pseudomonas sp. TUM22785 TaxID=3019098 RepID=UPI002305B001|nr:DUF3261 domain-containing protein [Pseudomonas sp. TUM22785]WCD79989.1 hypothetical protein PI990_29075 [Pseudomonas sp. TUM22785]